jgi:hypothetical protein
MAKDSYVKSNIMRFATIFHGEKEEYFLLRVDLT